MAGCVVQEFIYSERVFHYLQHGRSSLLTLILSALAHTLGLILPLIQWNAAQAEQEIVEDHVSTEDVFAEPHHATARHSGQCSIL